MPYMSKKINEKLKEEIQTPPLIQKINDLPKPVEVKIPLKEKVTAPFQPQLSEKKPDLILTTTGSKVRSGGKYAIKIEDEMPPLDFLRPLNEQGEFVNKKIEQEKMQTFYWRGKQKTLALILVVCSVIFLIMMLASSEYYIGKVWGLIFEKLLFIVNFVLNLPKMLSG